MSGRKGTRPRSGRSMLAAGIVVLGAAFLGFAATFYNLSIENSVVSARALTLQPQPEPSPTPPQPTSPVVLVADGSEAGEPWSLRGYSAVGQDVNTKGKPQLCLEWKYAAEAATPDFNCLVGADQSFAGPLISVFAVGKDAPPRSAFFGPVPPQTETVTVLDSSGRSDGADVYTTDDLASEITFFVGFTSGTGNVVVTGYDQDGRILWKRDATSLAGSN